MGEPDHSADQLQMELDELRRQQAKTEQELQRVLHDMGALRQSEERLSLALEAAQVARWEWDLQGGEIVWLENFEALLGLPPGDFAGTREAFLACVHYEDRGRVAQSIARTLAEGADYDLEFRLSWPDGSTHWVRPRGRIFFDSTGKAMRMIGVVLDITQHKHLEEQLRQSQKLEAVGRLAGGVAHDFNNLLTIITGYTDLLLEQAGPDADVRKDLEEIRRAGERAALMTSRLLAFSRKQVVQLRAVDLNAVIAELDKMMRYLIGEDIEIATVFADELGVVRADPGQIEQIIMNLAVNARDAMPQGGRLGIETANVELDAAFARRHVDLQPGAYAMLSISDTGHGMDRETLSHIFEPFFTTKGPDSGTGLGLSTVYGIIEQYGGAIDVESQAEEGTTFRIYLPRVEERIEASEVRSAAGAPVEGLETILLVEDEEEVRRLASRVLLQRGYTLLEARNGQEALMLCELREEPIDLLVTDVVMPGMSGRELAEQLVSLHPEVKVLYVSGYADDIILQHGVMDPGVAFLQKPFGPDVLGAKVREVLETQG